MTETPETSPAADDWFSRHNVVSALKWLYDRIAGGDQPAGKHAGTAEPVTETPAPAEEAAAEPGAAAAQDEPAPPAEPTPSEAPAAAAPAPEEASGDAATETS